jgi:hypothetical protein
VVLDFLSFTQAPDVKPTKLQWIRRFFSTIKIIISRKIKLGMLLLKPLLPRLHPFALI